MFILVVYITMSIVFIICVFYIIIASLLIHGARTVSVILFLTYCYIHHNCNVGPPWLSDPLAGVDRHLHGVSSAECYWWSDIYGVGLSIQYHHWPGYWGLLVCMCLVFQVRCFRCLTDFYNLRDFCFRKQLQQGEVVLKAWEQGWAIRLSR